MYGDNPLEDLKQELRRQCYNFKGEHVGNYKTFNIFLNAYHGDKLLNQIEELQKQVSKSDRSSNEQKQLVKKAREYYNQLGCEHNKGRFTEFPQFCEDTLYDLIPGMSVKQLKKFIKKMTLCLGLKEGD